MAAPKKPEHQKKKKVIKIMVTEREKENYEKAKLRLLNSSPPLRAYDILKYCVAQVDDLALIEFLRLAHNDSLKIKLRNDYIFSQFDNIDTNSK